MRLDSGRAAVGLDAAFLLAGSACALAGFAATYLGQRPLAVGLLGVLVGGGLGALARLRGWPAVTAPALAGVAYFAVGTPLVLRSLDVGAMAEVLVHGWKDLLTVVPPVAGDGPLVAVPWALGLAAGVAGMLLAGRAGRGPVDVASPALVPVLLLLTVVLLGVDRPVALPVTGGLLAALSVGWVALRTRLRTDRGLAGVPGAAGGGGAGGGSRRALRPGLALAMVAGAVALAVPAAGWALGEDPDRQTLRRHVAPPFDIGQYPSPLAGFRRYVEQPEPTVGNLYDAELWSVRGLPAGTRMRLAVMDEYDGTVWGASEHATDPAFAEAAPPGPAARASSYQRVSSVIDNPARGRHVEARVRLGEGFEGVFVPTAGAVQGLRLDRDTDDLRYNLAAQAAVVPDGLGPGDGYTFAAVLEDDALVEEAEGWFGPRDGAEAGAFLDTAAQTWSQGGRTPMDRVRMIARHLRTEGRYSDGVAAAERIYHAGHGVKRLGEEFVDAAPMAGNDEQYAATMALMANRVGVPARVVLGAVLPEDGVVRGEHVQAWVELRVADGSWRTLPTEEFMGTTKPARKPPQAERHVVGKVVPPAPQLPPPATQRDLDDSQLSTRRLAQDDDRVEAPLPGWVRAVLVYAGVPMLAVLLVLGAIVSAKALRRRRRRRARRPSARVAGAWRELVDHARDLGRPVPPGTRRAQGGTLGESGTRLAAAADGLVFGPRPPAAEGAAAYWAEVDAARRDLSREHGRWRRFRAAVDVRTLRPGGAR
jgi:hypothetical protein